MTHIPQSPSRRRMFAADRPGSAEAETSPDDADSAPPEDADAPIDVPEDHAPDADVPDPEQAAGGEAVEHLEIVPQQALRKKELVEMVVARSGIRKRDAKPAVEAALAILGEALSEGRELNLRPLGKVKVTRMKKAASGQIINARVRQPEEVENSAPDPLAPATEGG